MKTQRILGIMWLAFCCIGAIQLGRLLSSVMVSPHFKPSPEFFFVLVLCLAYLAGAVASIFLFRGAPLARKFVGLVAFLTLMLEIVSNVRGQPFSVGGCIIAFIALVSIVLLFLPRHDPVTQPFPETIRR